MIEVHPGLFVGPQAEYELRVRYETGWVVVHACKEPYHREAVGYTTPMPPEGHPEYLVARREHRLCLNLTDAPDPADIPAEAIDAAVAFIHENLQAGQRVFLHCQAAMSRSPGIAMLYLGKYTDRLPTNSFEQALSEYRDIYSLFSPRPGILGFLRERWAAGVRVGSAESGSESKQQK